MPRPIMVRGHVLMRYLSRLRKPGGSVSKMMNGSDLGEPRLLRSLQCTVNWENVFLRQVKEFEPTEKLRALAVQSA